MFVYPNHNLFVSILCRLQTLLLLLYQGKSQLYILVNKDVNMSFCASFKTFVKVLIIDYHLYGDKENPKAVNYF